jgi:DNA-binding response OmpR family regulator
MVTSKTSQEDLIAAFDVGVDDYITKPYQRDELLARIRALLRRGESWIMDEKPDRFSAEGLVIDFDTRDVWVRGVRLELTATEFNLLAYMARHPRQVLTYTQLIENIWPDGDGTRHGLSVHVSRLRKKIERNPKKPSFIGTRWGVGYVFMP